MLVTWADFVTCFLGFMLTISGGAVNCLGIYPETVHPLIRLFWKRYIPIPLSGIGREKCWLMNHWILGHTIFETNPFWFTRNGLGSKSIAQTVDVLKLKWLKKTQWILICDPYPFFWLQQVRKLFFSVIKVPTASASSQLLTISPNDSHNGGKW